MVFYVQTRTEISIIFMFYLFFVMCKFVDVLVKNMFILNIHVDFFLLKNVDHCCRFLGIV